MGIIKRMTATIFILDERRSHSPRNPLRGSLFIRGRYWDRTSDHMLHMSHLVEIPTWFTFNTIGLTFHHFDHYLAFLAFLAW